LSRLSGRRQARRWWSKLSQGQRVALVGAVIAAIAAVVGPVAAAVIPILAGPADNSRDLTHQNIPSTQTQGISAAVSGQFYRIFFPVDNTLSRDQQLKQISLLMAFPGPACAEVPIELYRIENMIFMNRSSKAVQGSVSAESAPASGFKVPSMGRLNFGCGLDQLHLIFLPPASLLRSQSTTPVVIEIPRRLSVVYQYLPSKKPLHMQVVLPSINDTGMDGIDYMAFRITATVSSGSKLDSCFVLSRKLSISAQGPRKCNSKVNGVAAFKPME
jgi:hypothetical protein